MDTQQRRRRAPASGKRSTKASPGRRRKTGGPDTPDRAGRQRSIQQRRKAKAKNPPRQQRVVRPPREEIPQVVYTPPKPMKRGRFLWKLVSMAAVVAAVFLGLSVFFRVDTITVAGADKYSPWMIRQASGINTGDALLSIGEARVASRIRMELPYVDDIKVGVRLPGTVEIQVTELQVTYSIEDENGSWWLISSSGPPWSRRPWRRPWATPESTAWSSAPPSPDRMSRRSPDRSSTPARAPRSRWTRPTPMPSWRH